MVLTDVETALDMDKAVVFRAWQQVNDYLPMSRRDMTRFEGCTLAWNRAFEQAGVRLDDLSLVETHDCFTIAELIEYEAMGLTEPGQGARAIREGWTEKGGRLPVNPSGGLKAKGHPIGATGVGQVVEVFDQFTGRAGERTVPNAEIALTHNFGATGASAAVHIFRKVDRK